MSDERNDGDFDNEQEVRGGAGTLVKPHHQTKTPSFYKVILLNDDFTPRDFVVHVLQKFFRKNEADATQLMLQIHYKGMGIAGVFTHEIAETKAYQVHDYAKEHNYPLRCSVEKA
jgi:ATP-dependent Clp protease adaptor protein ClpS